MTTPQSNEPQPETMIRDLHRIRESIVDSYGGDLHALTEDARRRQEHAGRKIWRKQASILPLPTQPPAGPSIVPSDDRTTT